MYLLDMKFDSVFLFADNREPEPLERRKRVCDIADEGPTAGDKGEYMSFKATVTYIKHESDPFYTACPIDGCNKKVNQLVNGYWRCEKCNKEFDEVS